MRCIELVGLSVLLAALAIAQYPVPSQGGGGVGPPATQAFTGTQNAGTDVVCAKGSDTISGLTCNNSADATTATAFASTVSIPAGTMSANTTTANFGFGYVGTGATPSMIISIKLGSTVVYTAGTQASNATTGWALNCNLTAGAAASTTTPMVVLCAVGANTNVQHNTLITATNKSVAVDTTIAQTLSVTVIFGANTVGNALWLYGISPGPAGAAGANAAAPAFTPAQNAGTDVVCALHADVITGLTCNNAVTDGTTETAFSSSVTIPAGTLSANKTAVNFTFGYIATATVPTVTFKVKLNGTTIYTSNATAPGAGTSGFALNCNLVSAAVASAATPVIFACVMPGPNNSSIRNTLITNANLSVAVNTTVSATLTITAQFGAATTQNAMWLYSIAP